MLTDKLKTEIMCYTTGERIPVCSTHVETANRSGGLLICRQFAPTDCFSVNWCFFIGLLVRFNLLLTCNKLAIT